MLEIITVRVYASTNLKNEIFKVYTCDVDEIKSSKIICRV